jgi:hypothetical protein
MGGALVKLWCPGSEKYIFGRFDSFCLRLKNLLEMFCLINKFTDLFK